MKLGTRRTKKKRGRLPLGRDPMVTLRLSRELLEAIDEWTRQQPKKMTRSAAVRIILSDFLDRPTLAFTAYLRNRPGGLLKLTNEERAFLQAIQSLANKAGKVPGFRRGTTRTRLESEELRKNILAAVKRRDSVEEIRRAFDVTRSYVYSVINNAAS